MSSIDPVDYTRKPASRIVRMRDVTLALNLSESHIYWLIAQGRFPKPFPLVRGGRCKGWLDKTIEEYLDHQARHQEEQL